MTSMTPKSTEHVRVPAWEKVQQVGGRVTSTGGRQEKRKEEAYRLSVTQEGEEDGMDWRMEGCC